MDENQKPQRNGDAGVRVPEPAHVRYFLGGFLTGVGCLVGAAMIFVGINPFPIAAAFSVVLLLLLMPTRRAGWERLLEGVKASGGTQDGPYHRVRPYAYWIKVRLQMVVGLLAGVGLLVRLLGDELPSAQGLFELISYALAIAAVIELAHTLFTPGPDEALDPLALGLSAALLLQLAKVDQFDYLQAIAALLYVLALGVLFAVRQRWSEAAQQRRMAVPWRR